jgi:hypothetical protein
MAEDMPRVLVVALLVGAAVMPVPASAGANPAARATCVEQCADAAQACVAAAGTRVTRKLERRCLRRLVRRCLRVGSPVCHVPSRCTAPDIVGTWEGSQVTCTSYCREPDSITIEAKPCIWSSTPFRVTVDRQGPTCEFVGVSEPFQASGTLNLAATPMTFELSETGVPIIASKKLRGRIEGDTLRVELGSASAAAMLPPFCSTVVTIDGMTRVAPD